MTTWDEMTDAKKLENVRRRHWRDYYKAEREAAKAEIARLEALNADLLAACEAAYAWMLYLVDDMVAPDERIALEKLSAAIAKARGEQ